jgi:hypothetical protein
VRVIYYGVPPPHPKPKPKPIEQDKTLLQAALLALRAS